MVKGISKQVIVVHAPDPQLFEQAIFILKEEAISDGGISEERLLLEAKKIIGDGRGGKRNFRISAAAWTAVGAFATGLLWFLSAVI